MEGMMSAYRFFSRPDSDGGFVTQWGSTGTGNGELDSPWGVDVDGSGNVYVAERSINNSRVQKFNSSGVFITKWGSFGDGNGLFGGPEGIAIDSNGNIFIAEEYNNRIQKFK
jgi:DNA-binding beta-propeller fold protein YncE